MLQHAKFGLYAAFVHEAPDVYRDFFLEASRKQMFILIKLF